MAERKGFEPLRGSDPPTGFQDRTLKPLGYLSIIQFCSEKTPPRTFAVRDDVAQKERFELSRCSSHPTPLAGEPLRPLGYFCKPKM
jgi:hypothetical protein